MICPIITTPQFKVDCQGSKCPLWIFRHGQGKDVGTCGLNPNMQMLGLNIFPDPAAKEAAPDETTDPRLVQED